MSTGITAPDSTEVRAWLDLSGGASGDMLLGALLDAGAPLAVVQECVAALGVPVEVGVRAVVKHRVPATQVVVTVAEAQPPHRTWHDVKALLDAAALPGPVRDRAHRVFALLADAEGAAHGTSADEVHFHEVGAHDAIADIVGVVAAVHALGIEHVGADTLALGGGKVTAAHGVLDVPVPAVREIAALRELPTRRGPEEFELCTPTGAALVAELVQEWGVPRPAATGRQGVGSGTRDLPDRANVLTVVLA